MTGALKPRPSMAMRTNGSKKSPAGALVVGGGFSGLITSLALARSGLKIVIAEEHTRVGWPPHCTGLVSQRVIENIEKVTGRGFPNKLIQSSYKEVVMCSGGTCARVEVRGSILKVDRVGLEAYLSERLESEGARIITGRKVVSVSPDGNAVLKNPTSSSRFPLILLAEGAMPRLRKPLGIGYMGPLALGVNMHLEDKWCDSLAPLLGIPEDSISSSAAYTVFDARYAPGFAWLVPTGDGCVVGAASLNRKVLRNIIGSLNMRYRRGHPYGGPLLLGHRLPRKLLLGRVITIGDAGGFAKPLSGGGLYPQSEIASTLLALMSRKTPLEALLAAAKDVASQLAVSQPIARLLLFKPRLFRCAIDALKERRIKGLDYDLHYVATIKAARKVSASRLVRCDPAGALAALGALIETLSAKARHKLIRLS